MKIFFGTVFSVTLVKTLSSQVLNQKLDLPFTTNMIKTYLISFEETVKLIILSKRRRSIFPKERPKNQLSLELFVVAYRTQERGLNIEILLQVR